MHVYNYKDGILKKEDSLIKALGIEERKSVISAAGAGGKTSTILQLAKEYEEKQQPAIVTTTTHMMMPEECPLSESNEELFFERLMKKKTTWAGTACGDGKFTWPGDCFWRQILRSGVPVLVEADGAKGKPVKVPADHEPVIPKETGMVLYVFGMDAVGQKIGEVCHRGQAAAGLLGKTMDSKLLCEDIAALALHKEGGMKGVKDSMEYHIVLNKTEGSHMAYGRKIAGLIEQKSKIPCHLTSYR